MRVLVIPDISQLTFMYRIDNVLFSHGGLTTEYVKWLDEELLDADIDNVIAAVNGASQDYLWNDESAMVVIDSVTGKYEKVEVSGKKDW